MAWPSFGFAGMSGAMALNMLVKHVPDQEALATALKDALRAPGNAESGRNQMRAFMDYLNGLIAEGAVERKHVQPNRVPFFVSAWWHVQDPWTWPVFYPEVRKVFLAEGWFERGEDRVENYLQFREAYRGVTESLQLQGYGLEARLDLAHEGPRERWQVAKGHAAQAREAEGRTRVACGAGCWGRSVGLVPRQRSHRDWLGGSW